MKEPSIVVNVELDQDENNYIGYTSTRLWPSLLAFVNHYKKAPIPGHVINGFGLTVINNLAIAIEGFVGDLINEKLKSLNDTKARDEFNSGTDAWARKKKIFNVIFRKKIETHEQYPSIEILFVLRNQIAHGKTHTEISKLNKVTGAASIIESQHKNYQKARRFLIENKLLKETDTSSNVNILWNLSTVSFFSSETRRFLYSLLNHADIPFQDGLLNELEQAYL